MSHRKAWDSCPEKIFSKKISAVMEYWAENRGLLATSTLNCECPVHTHNGHWNINTNGGLR